MKSILNPSINFHLDPKFQVILCVGFDNKLQEQFAQLGIVQYLFQSNPFLGPHPQGREWEVLSPQNNYHLAYFLSKQNTMGKSTIHLPVVESGLEFIFTCQSK